MNRIAFFLAWTAGTALTQAALPYSEIYRPQYHFTPAKNWMNDPNGLVFFDGEFHLFYQYNPFGNTWGHMSWGHSVSRDLLHWSPLPIALPERGGIMAFSGSVVVDWHNTSGFGRDGRPPLVAIYTGYREKPDGNQSQYVAFSNDRGRTWTPFAGNPVLDRHSKAFRDPKVSWYEAGHYWVMTSVMADQHQVAFFQSPDLKHWKSLSTFGPAGATGGAWECPDLFPLDDPTRPSAVKWVLIVNLGKNSINGGSDGQYFIGRFDGLKFTPDEAPGAVRTRWLDYGSDFYAAVTWSDIPATDGRRLLLGWMNNWNYGRTIPTAPWRSAQSLVRELSLGSDASGWFLRQTPIQEYFQLRAQPREVGAMDLPAGEHPLAALGISGQALELKATLELGSAREIGLEVFKGEGFATRIGYDSARSCLFVDRTHSGTFADQGFAARHEAPYHLTGNRLQLRIFLDHSSVEVFAGNGETVLTDLVFPPAGSDQVTLYSRGGTGELVGLQAWKIKSIWNQ